MSSPYPNSTDQVQIAIVGMTGSGKTVLVSTLAMKMSQMADKGVFLAPVGDNRRQTLQYVQKNWKTLNAGQWPPSTPSGEIVQLQWELTTDKNAASVRFADCAGQDVRSIFNQNQFRASALPNDLRDIFEYLNRSNILLLLVNMEDIIGRTDEQALQNTLDVDQMIYVLNQRPAGIPRKCAVVLSQYDKYKPEVDQIYGGDVLEYLRAHLPQLHGQYVRNKSFEIIPVAAVEQTQTILENGMTKLVPVPDFTSYNLEALIRWIANSVDELAPMLPKVHSIVPKPVQPPVNTETKTDEEQGCREGCFTFIRYVLLCFFGLIATICFIAGLADGGECAGIGFGLIFVFISIGIYASLKNNKH